LNRRTPVVAFSGLSSAAVANVGINAFMHKPFSRSDLIARIVEWAGRDVDDADAITVCHVNHLRSEAS
jgi:DNA-binding response OmpR family regulator